MEHGRSLLTSASPGRTAMVPAPIERSEVRGHDNRSENLQHLQRISVYLTHCPHARARRANFRASSEADRPARAAWSALRLLVDVVIFVLAKLLGGRFWVGAGAVAQAGAADVGFAR